MIKKLQLALLLSLATIPTYAADASNNTEYDLESFQYKYTTRDGKEATINFGKVKMEFLKKLVSGIGAIALTEAQPSLSGEEKKHIFTIKNDTKVEDHTDKNTITVDVERRKKSCATRPIDSGTITITPNYKNKNGVSTNTDGSTSEKEIRNAINKSIVDSINALKKENNEKKKVNTMTANNQNGNVTNDNFSSLDFSVLENNHLIVNTIGQFVGVNEAISTESELEYLQEENSKKKQKINTLEQEFEDKKSTTNTKLKNLLVTQLKVEVKNNKNTQELINLISSEVTSLCKKAEDSSSYKKTLSDSAKELKKEQTRNTELGKQVNQYRQGIHEFIEKSKKNKTANDKNTPQNDEELIENLKNIKIPAENNAKHSHTFVMVFSFFALIIGSLMTIGGKYLIDFLQNKSKGLEETDLRNEEGDTEEYYI